MIFLPSGYSMIYNYESCKNRNKQIEKRVGNYVVTTFLKLSSSLHFINLMFVLINFNP